ncbi:MAG: hypothetical protein HDR18_11090 [Lachnospiraceae bacterium]|nr:hypothetical protein [Lachnospiraceae bacterium]
MDLETGRARWIAVILLVCALIASVIAFRHYEQRGQEQSDMEQDTPPARQNEQAKETVNTFMDIGIMVQMGDFRQRVRLYQDEDHLYAFVPAAADMTEIQWAYDDDLYMVENVDKGYKVSDGDIFSLSEEDESEERFRITDIRENEEVICQLRLLQSENLPAVFICTESGSMDWIHADKGNKESGEFFCIDALGASAYTGAMEKISGRGNSSWVEDKKSYSVTLDGEAALAGMPAAEKWVLQANALDATRMRNKLTYDMAHDLGLQYAIDSAYVDLWLNGEYAGNYLLCEKIEAGRERVNISTVDTPREENGRYIRGNEGAWWEYESEYEKRDGYLLEFNERIEDEKAGYFYAAEQQVEVKTPAALTFEEYKYISEYARNLTQSTENAAQSDEYLEYIDLDSWSLLFLINELANDTDANRYSVFYYKDKDTKMYAGPIWDYDIAWGNDVLGKDVRCSFSRKGWYGTLYDNSVFYDNAVSKYREHMKPVLEKYLDEHIDAEGERIRRSIQMDDIRWAHSEGYTRRSPERDWQKAVSNLKDYIRDRMDFFDGVWLSGETYHRIFFRDGDTAVAVTYVRDGDSVPQDVLDYVAGCLAQNSWRTSDGEAYGASQPVYTDMDLYAQKLQVEE